jgi:hypothetical protein
MPLSGAWLAARRAPDPQQAVLHQADPEHFEPGSADYGADPAVWQAPPYHEVTPGPPVLGFEWVARSPGITLTEPDEGHGQAPGHTYDDGGFSGQNREPAVQWQHSDESYETMVVEGQPGAISAQSDEALRRGKNAEAANNPPDASYGGEGFRRGIYRWWNVNRRFSPPWRIHDQRVVAPWLATVIGDAPTPAEPGPYNSPFSSLSRARRTINARPSIRRIPPSFDEAVITDGSESTMFGAPPLIGGQWVAG